jgi:hypothetical protein
MFYNIYKEFSNPTNQNSNACKNLIEFKGIQWAYLFYMFRKLSSYKKPLTVQPAKKHGKTPKLNHKRGLTREDFAKSNRCAAIPKQTSRRRGGSSWIPDTKCAGALSPGGAAKNPTNRAANSGRINSGRLQVTAAGCSTTASKHEPTNREKPKATKKRPKNADDEAS